MVQKDMHRLQNFFSTYRLPILSGILIGTSYIPFPPWALFFCLVPLWIFWLQKRTLKEIFIGGWVTQFTLNLIGFHWIAYTAVEFGHLPWAVGILVLFFFASVAHLYYPIAGAIAWLIHKRIPLKPAAFAFLLMASLAICELTFPIMFPWHFGYPWLWAHFPGAQTADVLGFEGLNISTMLINLLFALAWRYRRSHIREAASLASSAILIFAALNLWGLTRKEKWQATDAEMKFLVVQGNIGNLEKIASEQGRGANHFVMDRFTELTNEGLVQHPQPDFIIWPETAFPERLDLPFQNQVDALRLKQYVQSIHHPLITGGYSEDLASRKFYNAVFLLGENGETPLPPYRKTILLAFGEYVPGAQYFPFLLKLIDASSEFGRGSGPVVFNWQKAKFGMQICYEGLYPWFSAGLAREGAEIFVNTTNDSWYDLKFEPNQHLFMTLARAIEFRRPLIRATNTGISTAILASGDILPFSPQAVPWVGEFKIPYRTSPEHTFYEKFHDMWIYILAFFTLLLLVLARDRSTST
jgi:apolipoprotein N-acyltransferase